MGEIRKVVESSLYEISLSRVWKLIDDDKYNFAILSAFLGVDSESDLEGHKELSNSGYAYRNKGFEFVPEWIRII